MDVSSLQRQLNLAASQRSAQMTDSAKEKAGNISPENQAKVAELAEQFESIFVDSVFKSMRKTVPKSDFMGGGNAEEIFRNMLDSEYAKLMAKNRSSGLADIIEKDLLKAMENRSSTAQVAEGQRVYAQQSLQSGPRKEIIIEDTSDSNQSANQ